MSGGEHNGQDGVRIGATLEQARREKGLSLRDVEQATKIRTRYLEGLEREDYSMLPDAVYVQGFLKTYANFLGLDGDGLAQEFKDRWSPRRERQLNYERPRESEFERPIISPGGLAGTERRKVSGATILTVALAVLLLAAVIGALYLIGSRSAADSGAAPGPEKAGNNAAPADPAPEPEPASRPVTEPREDEAIRVVVSVPDRPSWLSIQTDGVVAYEQTVYPGFAQTFEARDAISITAGDAGAVRIEVDGQDVGILEYDGQVTTETYTRKPAAG